MFTRLKMLVKDTAGATALEYAIVASVISVAALGGYAALGDQSNKNMTAVADSYAEAQDKAPN